MRVGLALPHYDTSLAGEPASWEGVKRIARLAEASGFDSLWVSDHVFLDWSKYGGPSTAQRALECWTTMAAVAAVTERVRIGSMALCNDFRHPGLVAKMSASLDVLSGGRLELGLGAGWYEPEYAALGIEFDPPGVRIARLGESAEVIRSLWSGPTTHSGRYYELHDAICLPGPSGAAPPIWFGGKGDYLIKTAARHADGWNFSWVGAEDTYRERAAVADRTCEELGRDPSSLRRSVGVYVLAGTDVSDAQERFQRLASRTPPGVLGGTEGSAVSWEEFAARGVAGTVGEVVDRLGRLKDLGVEEVIVGLGVLPFQVVDDEDVELVNTEVARAL